MVARRMRVEDIRETNEQYEGRYPRWMTVETCARYIDRTPQAVQSLVKRGRFQSLCARAGGSLTVTSSMNG